MIKTSAYGKDFEMDSQEAMELLSRFAQRIYIQNPAWVQELAPLLNTGIGYGEVGIDRQAMLDLKPRRGNLFASISGPTATTDPASVTKQKNAATRIVEDLSGMVDGVVHGATHWTFITDADLAAINKKKLSIGVMPEMGLWDLKTAAQHLPADFPRMHYLGIEGRDYSEHVSLFGSLPSIAYLLGGRKGAKAETQVVSRQNKPVICFDVEGGAHAINTFEGGKIVLPSLDQVIAFTTANMMPGQRQFFGKTIEFDEFDRDLHNRKVINLGFASTSGAFTNYPIFRKVLTEVMDYGIPVDLLDRVELTSGGTRYGGVWEAYEVAAAKGIKTNGLMCGQGLALPWANADRVVYVGDEWGDESSRFKYISNILLAFSGGPQTKQEIKESAQAGGRYPQWGGGIPVVAIYDETIGGATYDLFKEGYEHPNIKYFHTSDLLNAGRYLSDTIKRVEEKL